MLFDKIRFRNTLLSYLVRYALSLGLMLFYVWLTGLIEPLNPSAYEDVFLNFTAITICVMVGLAIKDRWRRNKNKH